MIGFSINLTEELDHIESYIKKMVEAGFKHVFATIYEPGEEKDDFLEKINNVGEICSSCNLGFILGLSKYSAREVDLDLDPILFESKYITGIRVTPNISNKVIADFTKVMTVGVSASHTTYEDLKEIKDHDGVIDNLQAWYYYYERDEIGLSRKYMKERNKFWSQRNIRTVAFAPGDDDLTGEFVPRLTLEKHRDKHPLYSTIDFVTNQDIDSVFIGDSMITDKSIHQFKRYIKDGVIVLYVDVLDPEYFELIKGLHRNRIDEAEYVIRAENPIDIKDTKIIDRYLISRPKGSLTIDNHRNGRFMGEFHITKEDMPLSNKANVIAHVREEDIDLLDICFGGTYFEVVENEGEVFK